MFRRIQSKSRSARGRAAIAVIAGFGVFAASAAVYATTTGPDFSVTVAPASQTIPAGYSASYTVMVSPTNGFQGTVTLSAGNLPKSTSAMSVTWTVGGVKYSNSAQVNVPAGSLGVAATLTLSGGQPATGTYTPTVTATSTSGLSHTTSMTLVIAQQNSAWFGLAMSPNAQTVVQGASTNSTINISRLNWSGSVSLGPVTGLPAGASATLTPTSTTGSSATLSIATSSTVGPGLYAVTVNASAATSNKTAFKQATSFTLDVQADASIAASAPKTDVVGTALPSGAISSALTGATSGASGSITLSVYYSAANTAPSTCTGTGWTTIGAPLAVNGNGTYSLPVSYTPSKVGTYFWYASYSGDSYNAPAASTCGIAMASTVVQDFSIATSPTSEAALTGGTSDDTAMYTTAITPVNGFSGTVALKVSGLPNGATASFNPSSTTSNSTLTVDVGPNVTPGSYPLTVEGATTINGAPATRTTQVTLVVKASYPFTIGGDVPKPLYPGAAAQAFQVTLTNPNSFPIKVTSLGSVGVQALNAPNCLSSWFKVTLPSIPQGNYISVAPNSSVTLNATAQMLDVNSSQDACQGQQLKLTYTGSYTK